MEVLVETGRTQVGITFEGKMTHATGNGWSGRVVRLGPWLDGVRGGRRGERRHLRNPSSSSEEIKTALGQLRHERVTSLPAYRVPCLHFPP